MRSSREWKLTTARRPPAFRTRSAAARPASSSSSSSLTAMRRAWKTRVAGWVFAPRRPPSARSTTSARSRVRTNGCSARRRTMALAIAARLPLLAVVAEDPRQFLGRRIVDQIGGARPTRCPCACRAARRACREKPRSASSICMEETPRSKATPSTPLSPTNSAMRENGAVTRRKSTLRRSAVRRNGRTRRVAIEGDAPRRPRPGRRAAVAAGAEGGVDEHPARREVRGPPSPRPACTGVCGDAAHGGPTGSGQPLFGRRAARPARAASRWSRRWRWNTSRDQIWKRSPSPTTATQSVS